jgi:hypothetical protein
MRRWHESGYRALSLLDAVDCIRRRVAFPARAFVLTFDDGYRTDEAFRGLQRSGQSAPRLPHSWRQASRALGGAITPGSRDGRYPAGRDSWRCSAPGSCSVHTPLRIRTSPRPLIPIRVRPGTGVTAQESQHSKPKLVPAVTSKEPLLRWRVHGATSVEGYASYCACRVARAGAPTPGASLYEGTPLPRPSSRAPRR